MSEVMEEFLREYMKREPYAPRRTLVKMLSEVEILYRQGKTPEEIINIVIQKNIKNFERIRRKYGVPGYSANIQVGNISVKLYGGNLNYMGEPMPANALFDIASMTKFYTQIIAYNLINEGVLKRSDKISDLNPKFVNLGDLTVDDILTFGTTFRTDGLIKDKKTLDEAMDTLYRTTVVGTGKWNYNDIGLIIMKEIMESLTGLTYNELVDKYIVYPLHLTDTHVIVPRSKYHLVTGTPNFREGKINDMTANALGGFSGHAGIFASGDDIIRLLMAVRNKGIVPNISDAYTPGKLNDAIGGMGNVYTSNRLGLNKTFVPKYEPRDTFSIAGSTRVNAASSSDSAYVVLFNPSSMDIEEARMRMQKVNEERVKKGLKPIDAVREFEFDRDRKLVKYTLIDPRQLLPTDDMAYSTAYIAETTLKLRFLDFLIKKYDKSIEEITVISRR